MPTSRSNNATSKEEKQHGFRCPENSFLQQMKEEQRKEETNISWKIHLNKLNIR